MGDRSSKDTDQTSSLETKGGMPSKFLWSHLVPDLSKITKTERITEMVLMYVWLSGIKDLLDTNSYF
jgi:hypothetical protein